MPEEAKEVKRKIIDLMKIRGPSLPVQVAKALSINMIFAGAFLSELYGEKIIKISNMKVGGSPLYYLPGQEASLENSCQYLPGKEKEAFLLLKEKKILKDRKQQPAIRVALRSLKDFAIPFLKDQEAWWRFYSVSEQEVREKLEPETEEVKEEKIEKPLIKAESLKVKAEPKKIEPAAEIKPKLEIKEEKPEIKILEKPKESIIKEHKPKPAVETRALDIFDKEKEKPKARARKKQAPEKFLEEVKSSLKEKNIELVSIEHYGKKELTAKIRFNLAPEKVHLLVAYDKKKINDRDLLKAYKKSLQYKLDYAVFFKGEIPKKLKDSIDAYKSLAATDKIISNF